MNTHRWRTLPVAIGFSLSGIVLLLFNFGVFARFEPAAQYLLAALGVLGACGFFIAYAATKQEWWRLIPAWTLLAVAGMVFLSTFPQINPGLYAALLFTGLSLGFVHIYALNRETFWWAIIPGGFMLVLGCVIALSSIVTRVETLGALLFIGMGLVFLALYGLQGKHRHWWALIPGGILVVFGLFVFALDQSGEGRGILLRWWPILLVLLGLLLALRTTRRSGPDKDRLQVHSAPAQPAGSESSAPTSRRRLADVVHRGRRDQEGGTNPDAPALPQSDSATATALGAYTHPAPGASIEVLPDPDQR